MFRSSGKPSLWLLACTIETRPPTVQEAVTFGECSRLPAEVWELLPSFDERIPLRWIMDSTNASAWVYSTLEFCIPQVLAKQLSGQPNSGPPERKSRSVPFGDAPPILAMFA